MKQIKSNTYDRMVDDLYISLVDVLAKEEDKNNLLELLNHMDRDEVANMTKVRKMLEFLYENN